MKFKIIYLYNIIIFGLWGFLQWNAHWRFLFFQTKLSKIESYYKHFKGTLRIIPELENQIILDLFHIVLHLLILIIFWFSLYFLLKFLKK